MRLIGAFAILKTTSFDHSPSLVRDWYAVGH